MDKVIGEIFSISNDYLEVDINTHGAQPWSVKSKKSGAELLWNGDKSFWKNRGPHMFPFTGRLYQMKYTYEGNEYKISTHGFARDMEYQVVESTRDYVVLEMIQSDIIKEMYPFKFKYIVSYKLIRNSLEVRYIIKNIGSSVMFGAAGGHPGFFVPFSIENAGNFDEYEIEFSHMDDPCAVKRALWSDDALWSGEFGSYMPEGKNTLTLDYDMFDDEAVFLSGTGGVASVKKKGSDAGITLYYKDFKYLGIWQPAGSKAPFVALEPWSGLPGRSGVIEDIENMPDRFKIEPGKTLDLGWQLEVNI